MDRRVDLTLGIVVMAFGGLVFLLSVIAPPPRLLYDPIGPYGFSIVISLFIVAMGAILAIENIRAIRAGMADEAVAEGSEDESGIPATSRRAATVVGLSFAYTLVLFPLGYVISTLLYVVLGLMTLGERGRRLLAACAIGYTALTFWAFAMVLRAPLPLGPLNDLFVALGLVDRIR